MSGKTKNFVQKFIFEKLPIKGAYVVLSDVIHEILKNHQFSKIINQLLSELVASNILLTTSVKIDGKISLQIQDNPRIKLMVSECSHEYNVRATAKLLDDPSEHSNQLDTYVLESGKLIINMDNGNNSYQSIIELHTGNLADNLILYMQQSEQLKTFFLFGYNENKVVGLMLQQLPDLNHKFIDDIDRIFLLANTLESHELIANGLVELFKKLFYEDDIRLFDTQEVLFKCRCSFDSVVNMLRILGKNEVDSIINELGKIEVTCEFCNFRYIFADIDIDRIFKNIHIGENSVSNEVH